MRHLTRYYTGTDDEKVLFDSAYVSHMIKPQQIFVHSFLGHKVTAPSLLEFEITGVSTSAYADGLGNIVIPTLADIEYQAALGVNLGTVTGIWEVYDDGQFLDSGDLDVNPVVVATDSVGPFTVRYLLDSEDGVLTTPVFVDPSSPLMVPVPIVGAGAVAPPYTASQSSAFNNSSFYGVERIFDNLGTDSSHTQAIDPPHWYRVDFQTPYVVTSYKLWGHYNASLQDLPVDYELQGSNDAGATWTAVDTQVNNPPPVTDPNVGWVSGGGSHSHLTLHVPSPGSYTSYRFFCTAVTPRNILRIRELQLIGYKS